MPNSPQSYGYKLTVDERDEFIYKKSNAVAIGGDRLADGQWEIWVTGFGTTKDAVVPIDRASTKSDAKQRALAEMKTQHRVAENESNYGEFSLGGFGL